MKQCDRFCEARQPLHSLDIGHDLVRGDALALAKLHRTAFPGFFLSQLGEPFLEQFYLAFADNPTAITTIARDSTGRPRAAAVGTTDPNSFFRHLIRSQFLGLVFASARATIHKPTVAPRLIAALNYRGDKPLHSEGALLSSICVESGWDGRGIGGLLLNSWQRRAQAMGARTAFLTTDAWGNDGVNRFYLRQGWTLHDQYFANRGRLMNRYSRNLDDVTKQDSEDTNFQSGSPTC